MEKRATPAVREAALRLTSAFEGGWGAVAGNFDGQVLSYGPLQWNIGQGTLIPVLRQIPRSVLVAHLGEAFAQALQGGQETLKRYVLENDVLNPDGSVRPEWRTRLRTLSLTPEARQAFLWGAEAYFRRAEALLAVTGWRTERGYAIAFDTAVQNGAPRRDHLGEYGERLRRLKPAYEWEQLKTWAHTVADLANPRWRNDVLSRKLTIALGEGVVHGRHYILEEWGISYRRDWAA